jgi:hypothetical protein
MRYNAFAWFGYRRTTFFTLSGEDVSVSPQEICCVQLDAVGFLLRWLSAGTPDAHGGGGAALLAQNKWRGAPCNTCQRSVLRRSRPTSVTVHCRGGFIWSVLVIKLSNTIKDN